MNKTTPEEAKALAKKHDAFYSSIAHSDKRPLEERLEFSPEKLASLIDEVRGVDAEPVPNGWKLMPIEPTEKIIAAMATAWQEANDGNECVAEYHAAIAAAPSQPAPLVPQTVQEIMRLMGPYISACVNCGVNNVTGRTSLQFEADAAKIDAAFKPMQAALVALVEKNHELQFSLDGVNGTAQTEPKCETCGGRGQVTQSERVGESDFNEWEIDCPVCDGAGHAPGSLQKHVAALNARIDKLQREAYDWWAAANTSSGVNAMRRPLSDDLVRKAYRSVFDENAPRIYGIVERFARAIEKAHGIEPEQGEVK